MAETLSGLGRSMLLLLFIAFMTIMSAMSVYMLTRVNYIPFTPDSKASSNHTIMYNLLLSLTILQLAVVLGLMAMLVTGKLSINKIYIAMIFIMFGLLSLQILMYGVSRKLQVSDPTNSDYTKFGYYLISNVGCSTAMIFITIMLWRETRLRIDPAYEKLSAEKISAKKQARKEAEGRALIEKLPEDTKKILLDAEKQKKREMEYKEIDKEMNALRKRMKDLE